MNQVSLKVAIVVVGAAIIQISSAFDLNEVECKGVKYQIDDAHKKVMNECLEKMGLKSLKDLNMKNAGCFSRCNMITQGLFDDAGKPHKEKIMAMIDTHVPEAIRGDWKSASEKCLDNEGSKVDMADDKSCASFMPVSICFHQAFLSICK